MMEGRQLPRTWHILNLQKFYVYRHGHSNRIITCIHCKKVAYMFGSRTETS
ncbi:hypothetical protein GW17_00015507 [Ensete ventricosum]|nr:hypothetical protein GW17_00015507 [Ensete ventricosum]